MANQRRKAQKAARRKKRKADEPARTGGIVFSGDVRIINGKILAQQRRRV